MYPSIPLQRSDLNQAHPVHATKNPPPTDTVTTTKLLKIALIFFAAVSGAIGYLALTIGTAPALILAIPTITITGLLTWTIIRMKDYGDPKELEQYRSEAAHQSLDKTAREHGWDKMFLHEIPRKEDFSRLYFDMVDKTSFDKQVANYEALSKIREKCIAEGNQVEITLPSPSGFLDKFNQQVRGKQLCDIFGKYSFEKLVKYKIVPENVLQLKSEYLRARDDKAQLTLDVEREFKKQYIEALVNYEKKLGLVNPSTEAQRTWLSFHLGTIDGVKRYFPLLTFDYKREHESFQRMMHIEALVNREKNSGLVDASTDPLRIWANHEFTSDASKRYFPFVAKNEAESFNSLMGEDSAEQNKALFQKIDDALKNLGEELSTAQKTKEEFLNTINSDFDKTCKKINQAYPLPL